MGYESITGLWSSAATHPYTYVSMLSKWRLVTVSFKYRTPCEGHGVMAKEPGSPIVCEEPYPQGFHSPAIRLRTFIPFSRPITQHREGLRRLARDLPLLSQDSLPPASNCRPRNPGSSTCIGSFAPIASYSPDPHPGFLKPFRMSLWSARSLGGPT